MLLEKGGFSDDFLLGFFVDEEAEYKLPAVAGVFPFDFEQFKRLLAGRKGKELQ